jgi:hypothetical protein
VTGMLFTPAYSDSGVTYGPFGLSFSYAHSFDGSRLAKDVEINFVFDTGLGLNAAGQAAYRAQVEASVESIWNNKFVLRDTATGSAIPIVLDVTTSGPRFDQTVAVHPGSGRDDALNWFVTATASVNAHETGHLLGLYDEYMGGGIDRYPNPTLSATGLMGLGTLSDTPELLARYFGSDLAYISTLNPDRAFELSAVPEPSTLVLLSLGSGSALIVRTWRRRRR